ncbi:efflux RND transporter periplasmic adaptor subunit [Anaeromyxobacter sp. PSR-1]|uniref:efflux RND transporter periplasmic adaptor subunit n=1 Tax=Anaeromyxobacter sp. PSR-1 TaxID=1300915 RepID=UPI0005E9495E|nr:efflux RND transporter periplasmic adaptor subunit [Anaeromyxobacter sp. PSR-1]GAO01485.1 cobalt-zinc-cadmium resistance protein CzcB [Anaeromyxobacter sp. PSR-1]
MIRCKLRGVLLAVALLAVACRGSGKAEVAGELIADPHGGDSGRRQPGAPNAASAPAAREETDPSRRGDEKISDLDRSVEDLFAAMCEHGKKTHECDECRYEVGVVRVPEKLVQGGLVKKASISRRRVEAPIVLTGEVRFDERHVTHVSPRVEGIVRKVHATLGERVRPSQPIVELESVQLGEVESDYLAAQAALRLARSSFQRQEQLRKEQISSEKEYLSARHDLEAAQIRARSAQEKLTRLGVGAGEVERLGTAGRSAGEGALVVRAPADGIILEMRAVPGELMKPDESIVTVGDVSSMWVWADLHEEQLGRVLDAQRGGKLRAEIAVKAFQDGSFPGAVDFVGPAMDERTRTVKVRVAAPNTDAKLRAGMFATVRIFLPGQEEALAVPRAAVLSDEGRSFVFVHHHGDYWVRRPIEPGRRWLDWVEVKHGLSGAETLAAEGAFLLKSDVLRSKMGAGCAD